MMVLIRFCRSLTNKNSVKSARTPVLEHFFTDPDPDFSGSDPDFLPILVCTTEHQRKPYSRTGSVAEPVRF